MLNSRSCGDGRGKRQRCRLWDLNIRFRHAPRALSSQKINTPIVGYTKNPRGERTALIKLIELPVRLEKGILHQILSVQHGTGHSRTVAVQPRPELADSCQEGRVTCIQRTGTFNVLLHIDQYVPKARQDTREVWEFLKTATARLWQSVQIHLLTSPDRSSTTFVTEHSSRHLNRLLLALQKPGECLPARYVPQKPRDLSSSVASSPIANPAALNRVDP